MNQKNYQLTRYPIGSIREVWRIAWPLMLALLSSYFMEFIDRFFLARYSIDAMNACATSGTGAYAFLILPMVITGISEVFVGQHHGEGEFIKMGTPVWQMIWFSLFLIPIFLLISYYLPPWIFGKTQYFELEKSYFSILISFGFLPCLVTALFGFYAGQGRVFVITVTTIIANLINFVLDYLLIFGFWSIPPLGIAGAGIATIVAQSVLVLMLFLLFFSKKSRNEKGTNNWKFNSKIFWDCLKIGFPASLAHTSEFFSHFAFFSLIKLAGGEYLTIYVLIQSIYLLIFFVVEGLSKAVTAISSNLIGAKQFKWIGKLLKSSFILQGIFFLVILTTFIFYSPEIFIPFFGHKYLTLSEDPNFLIYLYRTSLWLCIFWLIDGWVWALVGMLTGAGDTKFIMKIGCIAPWLLILIPSYLGLKYFNITIEQLWMWLVIYGLCLLIIYAWRYKTKAWMKIELE